MVIILKRAGGWCKPAEATPNSPLSRISEQTVGDSALPPSTGMTKGLKDHEIVQAKSGWYHGARRAFVPGSQGMKAFLFFEADENGRRLRSRLENILNVHRKVRLRRFRRLRPCRTTILISLNEEG